MVAISEERPPTLDGVGSSGSQQQASSSTRHAECKVENSKRMAKLKKDRERKRRERERKKQRKLMDPKIWSKNMDPGVWGNLPTSLTLEIFKRLPMRNFYQLREVCKDWNLVARERRCVTNPIHKPYFVLVHEGDDIEYESDDGDDYYYLHGILTFHIKSGSWRWKKLQNIGFNEESLYQPFSVKGLTFSYSLNSRRFYQVFDVHTRKRYNIPRQPKTSKMSCALGMTVDTSVTPHTFKIILGSPDVGTQIYDSVTKSWETRPSFLVPYEESRFKTCLYCGDYMYIWSKLDKILVYSLKEDKWSTLDPPPRYTSDLNWRGLGSWQGRIFTVNCDENATNWAYDDEDEPIAPLLWVWELVGQCEQTLWKNVDEMPVDMHKWLIPIRIHDYEDVQVHASFCDEHVLIYSWVPEEGRAFRFVLYNVATKTWEKVEVPDHSVSICSDDERDSERWDLEDMYSMQLEDAFQEASRMGQGEEFVRGFLHCVMGGIELMGGIGDSSLDSGFNSFDSDSDDSWESIGTRSPLSSNLRIPWL